MDPPDFVAHFQAQLGVEIGERFVEEQDVGFDHEGAGQGHTLLLSAGKLVWRSFGVRFHSNRGQRLLHSLRLFSGGNAANIQSIRDVFRDGHVRPERVILENHPGIPQMRRHAGHRLLAKEKASTVGLIKSGDRAQQGGLAATRWPQQKEQFLILDLQGNPLERDGVAKVLGQIVNEDAHLGDWMWELILEWN